LSKKTRALVLAWKYEEVEETGIAMTAKVFAEARMALPVDEPTLVDLRKDLEYVTQVILQDVRNAAVRWPVDD